MNPVGEPYKHTFDTVFVSSNLGAFDNYLYYVFLGGPYFNYSIVGPKTLF